MSYSKSKYSVFGVCLVFTTLYTHAQAGVNSRNIFFNTQAAVKIKLHGCYKFGAAAAGHKSCFVYLKIVTARPRDQHPAPACLSFQQFA